MTTNESLLSAGLEEELISSDPIVSSVVQLGLVEKFLTVIGGGVPGFLVAGGGDSCGGVGIVGGDGEVVGTITAPPVVGADGNLGILTTLLLGSTVSVLGWAGPLVDQTDVQ